MTKCPKCGSELCLANEDDQLMFECGTISSGGKLIIGSRCTEQQLTQAHAKIAELEARALELPTCGSCGEVLECAKCEEELLNMETPR